MNRSIFQNLFSLVLLVLALCLSGASVLCAQESGSVEPVAAAHGEQTAEQADTHGASSDPLSFDAMKRDLALWSLIIFLIVFAILAKYAFGPIIQALDAREQGVADQIASAGKANEDAKAILAQYQQKLADSKDEVRQILETARQDAERSAAVITQKAHGEAQQIQERAKKEIEAATVNALQSIAEKSASLATNLAGKMIRAEVRPESHRDMIQAALNDFKTVE